MSSPQVEDGFTSIAHELLEAMTIYPFTKMQYQILMVIFRKTYGYGKQVDDIALSHYEKHTRLKKPHVSSTLKSLEDVNAITKLPGAFGFNVSVNKHYKQWVGWDSEWDFVADSTKKRKVGNGNAEPSKKPPLKPEPDLTTEQLDCWEWAKTDDFWQDKVSTQADFLRHCNNPKRTLKTQYEAFMNKKDKPQRMSRIDEKNTRSQRIKRKSFVHDDNAGNGDFLEGECEVVND
jgi:phage replication O-like protein O